MKWCQESGVKEFFAEIAVYQILSMPCTADLSWKILRRSTVIANYDPVQVQILKESLERS